MTIKEEYTKNESGIFLPDGYNYFKKPDNYELTNVQLEEIKQWNDLIIWGRKNPVLFAEYIFGIELMDYQKYVFMMSWNTPYVVWCMGRNSGKSILGAIFIMTKTLLVPKHTSYILCGVGSQSIEMFQKIEMITNKSIESFSTLTDIFSGELVKSQANTTGFVHNPSSYKFNLYNDSRVFTLNGNYDHNRSKRSNLNFYDEAGFSPDELFTTSEPFCTQNTKFQMGVEDDENIVSRTRPQPFQNQLIYASSAGRTDQYFFKKYKEFSIRMDAGDKRYFCADISSDVVVTATKRGVPLPDPLLTQETIDSKMRLDKESALREYKNIFTSEGGVGQIIKRSDIIKNSSPRLPVFFNPDNKTLFGIAYDPARSHDNSVISIAEYYMDKDKGWKMRIVNIQSLVDILSKNKTPINTPNQISILKKIIADYNGKEVADYENIVKILVDAGSGGAGVPITDFFCEDYVVDGVTYRGIIDNDYNDGDIKKYPNAVRDKLNLVSPAKYKTDLFESLIKMMDQDLIDFTEEYNNSGYITLLYETDEKGNRKQVYKYPTEKDEKEYKKNGITFDIVKHKLDREEEVALKQIDMAKTELVNIYRYPKENGKDRFDLASDKSGKLNDDRAYTIALLGWQLNLLRRDHIVNKKSKKTENLGSALPFKKPKRISDRD